MGLIAKEMSLLSETWSSYRDSLITFVLQVLFVVPAVSLLTRILVASGVFFDWTTKMTFKTLATAACVSLATATAGFAATFTVAGTDYNIGTVTGTYDSFKLQIEGSDWWGDIDLAGKLALEVKDYFGFTQSNLGPLFAYEVNGASCYNDLLCISASFIVGDSDFENYNPPESSACYNSFCDQVDQLAADTTRSFVYAVSIPLSPVPLPAGGLLLLSGLVGVVALKRRKKRTA
jgi:hypothetical protein